MKYAALLVGFFSALVTAGSAQAAESKATVTTSPTPVRDVSRTINLDFPGGTLNELVATLKNTEGVSFNLVIASEPADGEIPLPPLSFRNFRLIQAAETLRPVLRARGFLLELSSIDGPNSVVCVIQRLDAGSASRRAGPPQFESYQITAALREQSLEDVIDAVRAAWEFASPGAADSLRLKFHPATNLLLVSGPDEAVRVTRSVLGQLRGTPIYTALPTAADEQRRLETVAEEVARRRIARESAAQNLSPTPAALALEKIAAAPDAQSRQEAISAEVARRRAVRETPTAPPTEASKAKAAPALNEAETKRLMDTVSADIARRRAERKNEATLSKEPSAPTPPAPVDSATK